MQETSKYTVFNIREDQTYNFAAYLIAQLGKNYYNGANKRISGKVMLLF